MEGLEETVARADRGGTTRGKIGRTRVRNIGKNYGHGKVGDFQEICMIFLADVFRFGEDFIAIWGFGK